jgi:hypothetical protein
MHKTYILFKYIRLKLGFGVVRWLEVCRILIAKLYITIIFCTFLMLSYKTCKYGNTGSYTSFIIFYSAYEKFVRILYLEHQSSV